MLNNIEDAPDDALDSQKKLHNVISSGLLSRREGVILTAATFVLALLLYAASGVLTLVLGGTTLALCYLYSAHPFRFKARPIFDVVSHALMLSGLLIAAGYFIYGTEPREVWLVIGAASLFSAMVNLQSSGRLRGRQRSGAEEYCRSPGQGAHVNPGTPVNCHCASLYACRHYAKALSRVAGHDIDNRRRHNNHLSLGIRHACNLARDGGNVQRPRPDHRQLGGAGLASFQLGLITIL